MYIIHIYMYVFSRYNTYRHIRVVNMMVTNDQKCGRETSPMESPVARGEKSGADLGDFNTVTD